MAASEARGVGISLWLAPEGSARDRLARLSGRLAARLGTVPFPPHVTLLAGLVRPEGEVLALAAVLASSLRRFSVRLEVVGGSDAYFRCLYLRAERTGALLAAHAAAARAFGRDPDPGFDPHLSLVYGELGSEARTRLAAEIDPVGEVTFDADRLHVWSTRGPVREWRALGAPPFDRRDV
jgi:2'-5' RNA ligase